MAITVSNIPICSVPVSTDYYTNPPTNLTDARQMFSTLGLDLYSVCEVADTWYSIFENNILRIDVKAYKVDDWNGAMSYIRFYDKRSSSGVGTVGLQNFRHCYIALGYDIETHYAYYLITGQFYYRDGNWNFNNPTYGIYGSSPADRQQFYELISGSQTISYTANGGGATHIAKRTGQLKDLSSYTSDILIVSGGGGGGLIVGETAYTGKEAGGISGSGDNSADQTTGNAFGQGESGTNLSGGGSGLYGGYKGTSSKSGGAGSGYIGNSLVSNKKMVGYNVPTSSAEGTKTESVEVYDSNYVANKPKVGNGHCRIKLLREQQTKSFFDVASSYDLTNVGSGITADSIDYSNYLGQIVFYGQSNRKLLSIDNGVFNYTSALSYTQSNLAFPLKDYPIRITKVTCKVTLKELRGDNRWVDLKIICNSGLIGRAKYAFTDPDPVNINVGEETSFTFDVSSSNMQATHIDFQFSYGIWEVKELMVSYV